MRIIVLVSLAAALAACQTAYQGNKSSPYYVVPAGTQLVLTQELRFDPDQLSVYVQEGRLLPLRAIQFYAPFCKFELLHRDTAARTVTPDQITIVGAFQHRNDGPYSRRDRRPRTQLAATALSAQMGGGAGSPLYSYVTFMNLRSEKQPEIFRLACLRWAYPGMDEHLSIAEIRQTLNPVFTLRTLADR
jgi:hypothetical protein